MGGRFNDQGDMIDFEGKVIYTKDQLMFSARTGVSAMEKSQIPLQPYTKDIEDALQGKKIEVPEVPVDALTKHKAEAKAGEQDASEAHPD